MNDFLEMEERIRRALENTQILKPPKQMLTTFGSSVVYYYLLSEPIYVEISPNITNETVVREGRITWGQPRILTPGYMLRMEGFGDEARRAIQILAEQSPDLAAILYHMEYRREYENTHIVSESLMNVSKQVEREAEKKGPLSAVIKGVDELWDVSLMKFVQEMIINSARFSQMPEWRRRGLIKIDQQGYPIVATDSGGAPMAARLEIEHLFDLTVKGEMDPSELKHELDKWDLYERYEDRFLSLFKKGG